MSGPALSPEGRRLGLELRAAAAREVGRRRRRRQRLGILLAVVAGVLAVSGAAVGTTFFSSTVASPTRTVVEPPSSATAVLGVLARPAAAADALPAQAVGAVRRRRPAAESGDAIVQGARRVGALPGGALYAVPLAGGSACLVAHADGADAMTCTDTLPLDRPLLAISSAQDDASLLVAGLARDGVRTVEVRTTTGAACTVAVRRNGFACSLRPLHPDTRIDVVTAVFADGRRVHSSL